MFNASRYDNYTSYKTILLRPIIFMLKWFYGTFIFGQDADRAKSQRTAASPLERFFVRRIDLWYGEFSDIFLTRGL